jgi:hypothetical protein
MRNAFFKREKGTLLKASYNGVKLAALTGLFTR